jgi:probable F420-dependent oxidoreductase
MRLGITIPLDGFFNHHMVELAREAERLGFTDAWSSETFQNDSFTPLAAAAVATQRMRLGTAIVNVFTRPAPLIAMAAASVQQISNGRLVLGVGLSTPTIVEQWMGIPYRMQVTRLRETVAVLRTAFSGQKVVFEGKTMRINGFRLDLPLETPPPIYIAAQGAQMLRTAGELGDGVIVNYITPETFPQMLAHIRDGARAADKPTGGIEIVCRIIMGIDPEEEMVREQLRRELTAYITVPQYNSFFREIGYEKDARAASEAWNAGDRKRALQSIPDQLVESIYVFGTPGHWLARLREFEKAGIATATLKLNSYAKTPEEKGKRVIAALEALSTGW